MLNIKKKKNAKESEVNAAKVLNCTTVIQARYVPYWYLISLVFRVFRDYKKIARESKDPRI